MGDSTAMTIEFLRARLLSERSVSRTARQRADQLAQRVIELEDQLKRIAIQRMKAEKATTEVLAILECQGVDGFAQVTSSSSEHDEGCDKWEENGNSQKGDEVSRVSQAERNVMEDMLSGTEVEGSSASQCRLLSWKSRSDSPNSRPKPRQTRTGLFSSIESYGKLELGKSCRRIKRRDARLATEAGDENRDEGFNANKEKGTGFHAVGENRDDNKGIKLEEKDPVIDWYHAEENAQREWEEKYNGRESAITSFAESSQPAVVEMVSKSLETGTQDRKETCLGYEYISNITEPAAHNLPDDQKMHGINKTGKQDRAQLDDNSDSRSRSSSHWNTSSENSTVKSYSEIERQLPQNPSVESVLISLWRAKISLLQHINVPLSRDEGVLATSQTYSQNQAEKLDIPIGIAELFRLPTDSFPQDDISRPKLYCSGLSLASAHTDVLHAVSTNSYQQPITMYAEAGHRPSSLSQKYDDDSYFISNSNRYSLPPYLTTDAVSFHNGFIKACPDARN